MANRHKKCASGGKVVYSGAGSNVVKEAAEHKRGGKADGPKTPGSKGKSRFASGGRVGANNHPFSSAYVGPSGGGGK